jgi:pentatricopeptide repeat protein
MKDRGYTTVDSSKMNKIFTLLATACYRASNSAMAIDQATRFLDEIKEKGMKNKWHNYSLIGLFSFIDLFSLEFRIEYRTFNALIAAFGKHEQVKMAFQLADEMVEVGFKPNEDTYASLLIACNSDKTSGLKYAIEVCYYGRTYY